MIALIGGEEFSDGFEDVHRNLVDMLRSAKSIKKRPMRVVYLPSNAAKDGLETVQFWCEQAQQRLGKLGLAVLTPLVIDSASANDYSNAAAVANADWVYLGGGFPHVGMGILSGSLVETALYRAHEAGALIAGASAGAMMLCEKSWVISPEMDKAISSAIVAGKDVETIDLPDLEFLDCLGLVKTAMCLPHLNQFFPHRWLRSGMLPVRMKLIGIDEQTALVNLDGNTWEVLGEGRVVIVNTDFNLLELRTGERVQL